MPAPILHVSHAKSGSTWITDILQRLAGPRFVPPQPDLGHLVEPLEPGAIYPRIYATREEVQAVAASAGAAVFVTIRDPRDTLISAYWSLRDTHEEMGPVQYFRDELQARPLEDGLIWLMDEWLEAYVGRIQRSWVGFEPLLRYEEILADDLGTLGPLLGERLGLGDGDDVADAISALRFEASSGGRARGVEDRGSHYRKGVAGDWRNYLSEGPVHEAFKDRNAELLIETGYERDADW